MNRLLHGLMAALLAASPLVLLGQDDGKPSTGLKAVRSLVDARKSHGPSVLLPPPNAPAAAPKGVFTLVRYPSDVGPLAAYLTPDPGDGKKHPMVIWCHTGFGAIGNEFWMPPNPDEDVSAQAFRAAGIPMMIPSWRGECDNPGRFELYYGEVDDLRAALRYARTLSFVDPKRIYLAGHSGGGTLVLLAAACGEEFRAGFSFGGDADLVTNIPAGLYANIQLPFDPASREEAGLRSARYYAGAIKSPTFYFEGSQNAPAITAADLMQTDAKAAGAPFRSFAVEGGDHFTILHSLTMLVASQIVADTGPECTIRITNDQVQGAFKTRNLLARDFLHKGS